MFVLSSDYLRLLPQYWHKLLSFSLLISLLIFVDHTNAGYLSPEVQIRNLKLFGAVTSEERYREEHDRFMVTKRKLLWPQHQPGFEASTYVEEESDEKTAISKL